MFSINTITKDNTINNVSKEYNSGKSPQGVIKKSFYDLERGKTTLDEVESRYLFHVSLSSLLSQTDGEINTNKYELSFDISSFVRFNSGYVVSMFPLSGSSFMEGIGENMDSRIGSTWLNSNIDSLWTNEGGDYYPQYKITGSIDESEMTISFDLRSFMLLYQNGDIQDNGFIMMVDVESEPIEHLSFYGRNTFSGKYPKVIHSYDDSVFFDGVLTNEQAVEWVKSPTETRFKFNGLPNVDSIPMGYTYWCSIDIHALFSRTGLNRVDNRYFLSGCIYSIYDNTRDRVFIHNHSNKVEFDGNAMYIYFSTKNFPIGNYSIFVEKDFGNGIRVKNEISKLNVI